MQATRSEQQRMSARLTLANKSSGKYDRRFDAWCGVARSKIVTPSALPTQQHRITNVVSNVNNKLRSQSPASNLNVMLHDRRERSSHPNIQAQGNSALKLRTDEHETQSWTKQKIHSYQFLRRKPLDPPRFALFRHRQARFPAGDITATVEQAVCSTRTLRSSILLNQPLVSLKFCMASARALATGCSGGAF